jgi:hypothetical protein
LRTFWPVLALALPVATAPASGALHARPVPKVTGIVQTVKPHAVIVRRSDGTLVRVPVGPATVVKVNLARSSLDAVRPGYFVTTEFGRNVLIALDPSGNYGALSNPGTVTAVSARSVVVANWHKRRSLSTWRRAPAYSFRGRSWRSPTSRPATAF